MVLAERGENEQAEASLKGAELSSLLPIEEARFAYWAGMFYWKTENPQMARAELERAVEVAPFWLESSFALARTYLDVDNVNQAVQIISKTYGHDLDQTLRWDPVRLSWFPELDMGELAMSARRKLMASSLTNFKVPKVIGILQAGQCLQRPGGLGCAQANAQLSEALNTMENDVATRVFLARIHMRNGNWPVALKHLNHVQASSGESPLLDAFRGRALLASGRTAEAEQAFNEAYLSAKEMPGVYFQHAEALRYRGENAEALKKYKHVAKLDKLDVTTRAQLLALGRALQ